MYITNNIFSVKFNIVPSVFLEVDRFDDNNYKVIQRWRKQDSTMGSWTPTAHSHPPPLPRFLKTI